MMIKKIQVNRRKQSDWVNSLGFKQRKEVVQLYQGGVSISAIAKIYQVNNSPIRYHLKKFGVYICWKKPQVTFTKIEDLNKRKKFDFHNSRGEKLKAVSSLIEEEKDFPKSYAEYVQRSKARRVV